MKFLERSFETFSVIDSDGNAKQVSFNLITKNKINFEKVDDEYFLLDSGVEKRTIDKDIEISFKVFEDEIKEMIIIKNPIDKFEVTYEIEVDKGLVY